MTRVQLSHALRAGAGGILTAEAAVDLLIAHAYWLDRADFAHFIDVSTSFTDPAVGTAFIDWPAAIAALNAGTLPCSAGERRMLHLSASLADQTAIHLGDTITGLDRSNAQTLIQAIKHITGCSW